VKTGRTYRSSPWAVLRQRSQLTGAIAVIILRQRLWLYTTRDKLHLRPSTTVPILDHLVWDVVGEGAGVLMRVVRRALTAVSICMLQFRLF
jgi:hypothetical protein